MQPNWQIPRPGLFWLLTAFAALTALHADHLPGWVLVAAALALVWRVQIYRGVMAAPGRLGKIGLVLLCAVGIVLHYRNLNTLDPFAALLVSGFVLKLLEMHHRRDALILIFLGYLVAIVQCLFSQTVLNALLVSGCLVLVTAALSGLHQTQGTRRYGAPIRTGGLMLVQAIPLMLVLFIVMPRLGSMWTVPQPGLATIGMSDRMSPGDFARFGASADIAFRAEFTDQIPSQPQLYWRGLVLSRFDGREWSSPSHWGEGGISSVRWANRTGPTGNFDDHEHIERLGQTVSYTIVLEPSYSHWVYALTSPLPKTSSIGLTADSTLLSTRPVASKTRYQVTSWLDYRLNPHALSPRQIRLATQIPKGSNPQTQAVAKQWAEETPQSEALIKKVLMLYNQQYIYSLEAPALGEHTVDEFLWQTRTGFCEHFASSFVFFMRAAGVPARVVVGYQGGERHPTENYLIVHQYDAHAWAEVWLERQGWVRVDPTAAVAPERIQLTAADLLADQQGFLADSPFSTVRFNHIAWVNRLRLQLDRLDYVWAKWVLGYDDVQQGFLASLLGEASPQRIGLLLLLSGGAALLPLGVWFLMTARRQPRREIDRLFLLFCQRLARAGVTRCTGEGLHSLVNRANAMLSESVQQTKDIAAELERHQYGEQQQDLRTLRSQIRSYKPKI